MRLRVCVYVCTSDEFCAEERECWSRSQRASVEKSRRKTEQSERCEKENRVYRELRELRTQCTLLLIINSNKPILFIQLQINNHHLIKFL